VPHPLTCVRPNIPSRSAAYFWKLTKAQPPLPLQHDDGRLFAFLSFVSQANRMKPKANVEIKAK
jgi:hypothetical protein